MDDTFAVTGDSAALGAFALQWGLEGDGVADDDVTAMQALNEAMAGGDAIITGPAGWEIAADLTARDEDGAIDGYEVKIRPPEYPDFWLCSCIESVSDADEKDRHVVALAQAAVEQANVMLAAWRSR